MAINKAQEIVKKTGDLPIPLHLRNAPTKLMKALDYGKDYKYAHDYKGNFVLEEFLPDSISNTRIYEPGESSREEQFRQKLKKTWGDKYGY
jgi:putative ATPase